MERGSAQHGARIDDELAQESDALAPTGAGPGREREDLDPEALTADEEDALAGSAGAPAAARDGEALVHAELIARSELARWLLPSAFPASGATLARVALGQDAPDELPERLDALGSNPVFETVGELWIALGGAHEEREPAAIVHAAVEPERAADVDDVGAAPDEPQLTEEPPGLVAGSLLRLITLPPRVAISVAHMVGDVVGRGLAALTPSGRSSS